MKINLTPLDFSTRQHFPGAHGNPFDRVLHTFDKIQAIPAPVFAILLLLLAALTTRANLTLTIALFLFFSTDWLAIALLPHFGKSYGPPQPPTLILAFMRSIAFVLPTPLAITLQFIGTLLMLYAFWIEPHRIHITRQKFFSPNRLPSPPLRVLHISDLHLERMTRREQMLNEYIRRLNPDIILFSGDFLSLSYREDEQAIQQVRQLLEGWQAPLGVYAVSGSPAVDLPHIFPRILEGLPIQRLENQSILLETQGGLLRLIGLTCTHNPTTDAPKIEQLLQQPSPPGCFTILLYHSPDLAPALQNAPIDLMLSGHTHGGQVRLPLIGALFTASLYGRKLQSGRYELNKLTLYISRGIGLEGAGAPRVRFLCPPEIILWEIEKQPSKSG